MHLERPLKLRDQFGSDEVRLRLPLYFGVTVVKRHREKTYLIRNDRAHLRIFSVMSRELQKCVRLRNQFANGIGVRVVRSLMLAAPSLEREWNQL